MWIICLCMNCFLSMGKNKKRKFYQQFNIFHRTEFTLGIRGGYSAMEQGINYLKREAWVMVDFTQKIITKEIKLVWDNKNPTRVSLKGSWSIIFQCLCHSFHDSLPSALHLDLWKNMESFNIYTCSMNKNYIKPSIKV